MGIFSRLTDIINANIHTLLERAEDPEKMIRLMIQEMEDTLVEVRSGAVKTIADKKEIERKIERLTAASTDWQKKAEFALNRGREDLAKGALVAKRKVAEQGDVLKRELEQVNDALTRRNDDLSKLQSKLDEAKARKKALEIRMKTAKASARVRQTLHDGRVEDALGRYETLERRIDELEADAEVYDLGKPRTLREEFADLEAEADVEDELAKLKAKVSGGQSAPTGGTV